MRIGDRVRHNIHGLTGLITGRTEYRNGCRQFLVERESLDKDGKTFDGIWTDEQNLELVDEQVFADPFYIDIKPKAKATAGGPDRVGRPT